MRERPRLRFGENYTKEEEKKSMISQALIEEHARIAERIQAALADEIKKLEEDTGETAQGVALGITSDKRWVYNTDAKPLEDILRQLQFGRGVRDVALLERWAQALETHSIDDTVLVIPPEGPAGMSEGDRAKLDVVLATRKAAAGPPQGDPTARNRESPQPNPRGHDFSFSRSAVHGARLCACGAVENTTAATQKCEGRLKQEDDANSSLGGSA